MQPPPERSRDADHSAPIRVLHVDDDPEFAGVTARSLEHEDDRLTVETATSAREGLDRLAADRFDCIVSDYEMPGRNGIEFLAAVRRDYPDLPFILFTGKGSESVASEAISAGVTDYLQKGGGDQYAILANRIANVVEGYRSRHALEERSRRLTTLISNLPGIAYRCRNEPGWPMVFVEGECAKLTGYPAAALETGDVVWGEDVVHPDDREEVWDAVQAALATDDSFEITYRVVTAEGATRWMWERGREVYPADGERRALEGFITDITARKEREAELERYETLVETVAGGVFAQDAEGRYSYVNTHIEEQTGYDREEIIGRRPSMFLPEGDVERIDDGIREMLAGRRETVAFETTLTTATGETVPIEGQLALLPSDDGFSGTVGVVRDITERKERERKLDRLRDRVQALMYTETKTETAQVATEAADDIIGAPLSGVHLLNDAEDALEPSAVVETVPEAFDEMPRYPRAADPGSRAALVWDAFESGESVRIDDTHAHDRLTERTPARSVIIHPVGRHGVFIVSSAEADAFDDTDEALVELLATSLTTALDRVEREAELRRQRDELQHRNERLDRFTSVVSHDLRNPLNIAGGHLDLARAECDSEHLGAVARAHERMSALVDDLLTIAREGEKVTGVEPIDLADLVEDCWQNVETRTARLVVDTDRTVRGDRSRVQQLLENLVRNAVEHGGERVVVTVGDLDDGFFVEDDGPGIPPDEREAAFEVGYSTTEGGTGFGLSIVQEVANAHDWDVSVTEGTDGGARFEITGVG